MVCKEARRQMSVRLPPGDDMKKKTENLLIKILEESIRVKDGSLPISCYDFKKTAHRKPMKYGLRRKVAK
jgi:hypothetical protein